MCDKKNYRAGTGKFKEKGGYRTYVAVFKERLKSKFEYIVFEVEEM